jgi:hypothetical protein
MQDKMCVESKYNEEVLKYYYLSLLDILAGVTFEEMEAAIIFYEELEHYEAAAGILKAINESEYYTINDLTIKIEQLEDDDRIKGIL